MPSLIVVTLAVVALVAMGRAELQRFEAVEPHMGTLVRITLYTPDEESARQAFRAGFDRIADLDRILSDYKPDSELNAITEPRWAVLYASAMTSLPCCARHKIWPSQRTGRSTSRKARSYGSGATRGKRVDCRMRPN